MSVRSSIAAHFMLGAALPAALVAALATAPAAAQSAPDAGDTCFSDRNGLNSALPVARSCAAVTANGTYGRGYAGIGNGRESSEGSNGGGAGGTSWSNDGWTNSALANSENGGIGGTSSDLTTGRLRASASTYTAPGTGTAQVFTLARMGDVITFLNESGADQIITLGYEFDGQFADAGGSSSDYGYVHLSLGSLTLRFADSGGYAQGAYMQTDFSADGLYTQSSLGGAASDYIFSSFGTPGDGPFGGSAYLRLIVPQGVSTLAFGFALNIGCRVAESSCQFGNTSSLTLGDLPVGVTYTSQSGVLFSGLGVGAVPEPATWAMMILGFGLIGGALRRRGDRSIAFTDNRLPA